MGESISAVIPTLNSARTIGKCIASVLAEGVSEIIVVDGSSSDTTLQKVADRAKVLRDIRGIGRAKDLGWRAAKSKLILFLDADAFIPKGTLDTLYRHLNERDVAGASCRVHCANPSRRWSRLRDIDFKYVQSTGTEDCVADPTICGLFKRGALEEVSGFDHRYPFAEDLHLLRKLRIHGYRVLSVDGAVVYHHHRETLKELAAQFYNHGYGRGLLRAETGKGFYLASSRFASIRRVWKVVISSPSDSIQYLLYRLLMEVNFLAGYLLGYSHRKRL